MPQEQNKISHFDKAEKQTLRGRGAGTHAGTVKADQESQDLRLKLA